MLNLKIYKIHPSWESNTANDDDDDDDTIDGMGGKPFARQVRFFDCIKTHRWGSPKTSVSRYCAVRFDSQLPFHNIGIERIIFYFVFLSLASFRLES